MLAIASYTSAVHLAGISAPQRAILYQDTFLTVSVPAVPEFHSRPLRWNFCPAIALQLPYSLYLCVNHLSLVINKLMD